MLIQDIIKNRRLELGLTMKQVADCVGVSEGTVSRWESGDISNMKRDKIYKLSKILKISPLIILGWEEGTEQHSHTPQETRGNVRNIIRIAGRNGSYEERVLTDDQFTALKAIIDQMPDASGDL